MAERAKVPLADDGRICNMGGKRDALIEDLYQVEGKAEIVNGELVLLPMSGWLPVYVAGEIFVSLREYGRRTKIGFAASDGLGFVVSLPNRWSFAPDVAFTTVPPRTGKFVEGAPLFAVEVRSESDYGLGAERQMAAKRADYFAAGTLVVWDVDVLKEQVIRVYRASDPANATTYRRGDTAEAEPALPGWKLPVADIFPSD